jgi:hypothetical protein
LAQHSDNLKYVQGVVDLTSYANGANGTNVTLAIHYQGANNTVASKNGTFYISDLQFISQSTPYIPNTVWDGNTWTNGIAPTNASNGIIVGNYSQTADIVALNLTQKNNPIVSIPSGNTVTLGGSLNVVSGSFTLENNAKLIQTTEAVNTGSINVKRNSTPMVRLDYTLWSSPVTAQNLFAFSPATITSPITRFYSYNTATNNYSNTGITNTSTFIKGKGYAVRAPNTYTATPTVFTGTFAGVPNNGPISIALDNSNQGFNLVGNPYPSPIDATALVNANSSLINGTLYFYSHNFKSDGTAYESGTGIQYATWNSTGAAQAGTGASAVGQNTSIPNGTIQVGQGFIVKATAAGNLSFTNAMRSTNSADQFFKMGTAKKPETTEKHRFWLDLTNEQGDHLSQMLVGYVDGATNGEDNLYDGEEFGNPQTSLSSRLNGKNYTIQGRALPFIDTDVVPLDFKAATNGTYTIALTKTDGVFASNQKVVLKDNATGKVTDLKAGAYTFSATAGSANSRFELLYDKSAINKTELAASTGVIAVKKQGVFQVNTTDGSIMKEISVYDIQGHLILKQENINSNTTTLSGLPTAKGIFILKVTNQTNQINTIKIIN